MIRFWATLETVQPGRGIVTLYQGSEWSGAGRIEIGSLDPAALYEAAYIAASRSAQAKGGQLDRFTHVRPEPQAAPLTITQHTGGNIALYATVKGGSRQVALFPAHPESRRCAELLKRAIERHA